MDIQIATLCDFAADYGNGKMVINGTFDALRATKLPVVHPHCSLAMRICVLPEDSGDHRMTINIIDEDGNSQRAQYNWTYPGGIESGEYDVDVEVRNTQGETFLLDHDGVTMSDFGISLTHGSDRVVEYIAPSSTTAINLDLRHVGASGSGYNLLVRWQS